MGEPYDWTSVNWDDIYPRLWLFARDRVGRAGRRVRTAPEEFAENAIRKTVEGVRRWTPEQAPLFKHLCEVVICEVRNAVALDEALAVASPQPRQKVGNAERHVRRKLIEDKFVLFLERKHPHLVRFAKIIIMEPAAGVQKLSRELQVRIHDIEDMWTTLRGAARDFVAQNRGDDRITIGN